MVGTPTSRRAVYYFANYEESEYQGRQRITRQHVTVPETVPTVWPRLWERHCSLKKKICNGDCVIKSSLKFQFGIWSHQIGAENIQMCYRLDLRSEIHKYLKQDSDLHPP
jgi:hypothetical protein